MKIEQAVQQFRQHQQRNFRPITVKTYAFTIKVLTDLLCGKQVESFDSDEVFQLLSLITEDADPTTKHLRFAQLRAFFNFCIDHLGLKMSNPCVIPSLKKLFRPPKLMRPLLRRGFQPCA